MSYGSSKDCWGRYIHVLSSIRTGSDRERKTSAIDFASQGLVKGQLSKAEVIGGHVDEGQLNKGQSNEGYFGKANCLSSRLIRIGSNSHNTR